VSLPLKDFRTAIPETTDMWLEIEAAASGRDKAAIGRDILNDWAKLKAHAFKVAAKKLQANGLQMELIGDDSDSSAPGTESHGTGRSRR
jgi:hypothetical protein